VVDCVKCIGVILLCNYHSARGSVALL